MAWPEGSSEAPDERCFELYHENSKIGRRVRPSPMQRLGATAASASDGDQYPLFAIGEADAATSPIGAALGKPAPLPQAGRLSMKMLATLLSASPAVATELIDIYFHVRAVDGLPAGLYRLGA